MTADGPKVLIVNHLWQSSCFVLLAASLAFVLRKDPPKVRYWIWLSASLKFLVPMALLVGLGSEIHWPSQGAVLSVTAPVFSNTLIQIAQPFSPPSYSMASAHAPRLWVPVTIAIVWALGFAAITMARCRSWLRIRAIMRAGTPVELPIPIPAVIAAGAVEPGIVGFLRPVLVLPAHLMEHLSPRQLDAILAHEMCHVRRRDNLFAAIHMVVEAIFWFHPLVWWIGSRLVEERELACDQEVLRTGCEPTDYVEGILSVCRLYTESQLPCVSGVTGADVKMRLRAILTGSITRELTVGKKAVLAAIGVAAFAAPILIGVLDAPQVRAQSRYPAVYPAAHAEDSGPLVAQVALPQAGPQPAPSAVLPAFESASINAVDPSSPSPWIFPRMTEPRGFEYAGTVASLIQWAYGAKRDFQVLGGPGWVGVPYFDSMGVRVWPSSEMFEIHAKSGRPSSEAEMKQMVQVLLADRFNLKLHRQAMQIPIYAIVVGPNGPNLPQETLPEGCPVPYGECGFPNIGGPEGGVHTIVARGATMPGFASLLTNNVDRPVIDKTGLTAGYNFDLPYDHSGAGWRTGPAIFTAIQTLGLKLEPQTETFEVLVIDSAGHPFQN